MNPSWRNKYLRYKGFFLNVMMRYKEKPQVRAYIEIVLSLATISIFGVYAIKPTAITIAQLLKEIEAKKETLVIMEEKIKNLELAQRFYMENSNKITLFETAIPKKPSPESFARQVEGLSGKNNVEILKVSISGGPLVGKPKIQQVEIPPEGEGLEAPVPEEFPQLGFTINMKVPVEQYIALSDFASDLLYKIRNPLKLDIIRFDSQSNRENKSIILLINGRIPYNPD